MPRPHPAALAAAALLAAAAAPASADVLFDNFGPGDAYLGDTGWTLMNGAVLQVHLEQAANFTVAGGDFHLDSIDLAVGHLFGPNYLEVRIHADDNGAPGAVLEEVVLNDAVLPMPNDPNINNPAVPAPFGGTTLLEDGATYWVSLSSATFVADSWLAWNYNVTGDVSMRADRTDGGPWVIYDNHFDPRGTFRVNGTPVPEPASAAALLLGAAGLLLARRRRRTAPAVAPAIAAAVAAGVALSAGAGAARADTVIDTVSHWNGTDWLESLGEPNTATMGQTFTVPAGDTSLASFTFHLIDFVDHITFDAYVHAWDGEKATGPALFHAGPFTTDNNDGNGGFEAFKIDTGGLQLDAGQQYVAYFTASDYFQGGVHWANPAYLWSDHYDGGGLVFRNNGTDLSLLTTTPWETFIGDGVDDLAFTMEFTAVPEPAGAGALLALAAGALARRRR